MKEKATSKANQSVIINSVDRTLDVIEYLYKEKRGISISQISKELQLYKSTVYRTLATLQNRGYVVQNEESGLYSLGPKFYVLSEGDGSKQNLSKLIMPYMEILNDRFRDAVNLAKLDRGTDGVYRIVILGECASKLALGAKVDVGAMSECYCASLGKCLLAFSEDIDLSVYETREMRKFTDTTITTLPELKEELERVRRKGYALDAEEREKGLFCIGVPILRDGVAVAAISLSGPTGRIRDDNLQEKIAFMKSLSEEITKALFIS